MTSAGASPYCESIVSPIFVELRGFVHSWQLSEGGAYTASAAAGSHCSVAAYSQEQRDSHSKGAFHRMEIGDTMWHNVSCSIKEKYFLNIKASALTENDTTYL